MAKIDKLVSTADLNHVVEQNNFTNLYLESLGKQVRRIETSIMNKDKAPASTSFSVMPKSKGKEVKTAFIKPQPSFQFKLIKWSEFLKNLLNKLGDLNVSKTKRNINVIKEDINNYLIVK